MSSSRRFLIALTALALLSLSAGLVGCGPTTPVPSVSPVVPPAAAKPAANVPAPVLAAAEKAVQAKGKTNLAVASAQETSATWTLIFAPVLPPGTAGVPYSMQVTVDKASGEATVTGEAY